MDLIQQIKRNINLKTILFMVGLVIITAVMFVFETSLYSTNLTGFYYISSSIVVLCMLAYVLIFANKLFDTVNRTIFLAAMMVISVLFTIAGTTLFDLPLWAVGSILIAGLIDRHFGLITSLFFLLQVMPIMDNRVYCSIFTIIILAIICMLLDKVTNIKTMLYLMVITSTVSLSLSLILNRLVLADSVKLLSTNIIITYLAAIGIEHIIFILYGKNLGTEKKELVASNSFDYLNQVASDTANSFEFIENLEKREQEAAMALETEKMLSKAIDELNTDHPKNDLINEVHTTRIDMEAIVEATEKHNEAINEVIAETINDVKEAISEEAFNDVIEFTPEDAIEEPLEPKDYSEFCDIDSELLTNFKETKKSAFISARKIAMFGTLASKQLDVNDTLVEAISLLSKVGKMLDGNFAQDTHDLLVSYNIDADVIEGCDEVNGYEEKKITSKEAGIVSLTDTIISSYTLMKQLKKSLVPGRFVDMTLGQVSVSGKIAESGLTLAEIASIRNCYVEQISKLEEV